MNAKDSARSIGVYWEGAAAKLVRAGNSIDAAKRYRTAAIWYGKAGETAMAAACSRRADELVPMPDPKVKTKLKPGPKSRAAAEKAGSKSGTIKAPGKIRLTAIFDFICTYKGAHDGVAPSVRQIGDECQISSTSVVIYYLSRLQRQGLITYEPGHSRTIQVCGGNWSYKPTQSTPRPAPLIHTA